MTNLRGKMSELDRKPWGQAQTLILKEIKQIFQLEDTRGIEFISLLQQATHLSMEMDCQGFSEKDISGPRWALMLYLYVEEISGSPTGLTPTKLSDNRHVSKNTISALLRGLEAQGLVQRQLDPKDLRHFFIHLTPAGREMVQQNAADRIVRLNRMVSGITQEEFDQLKTLLGKYVVSLKAVRSSSMDCPLQKDGQEN
jgi:DNA-binding MarR family transcriptional regulator